MKLSNKLSEYVARTSQKPEAGQRYRFFGTREAMLSDVEDFMRYRKQVASQLKFDGTRVFVMRDSGRTVLVSRHNGIYTSSDYPALFSQLAFRDGCVLDGEFIRSREELHLFDALYLDGVDIRSRPLSVRLLRMGEAVSFAGERVHMTATTLVPDAASALTEFDKAVESGFEGTVLKDLDSPYGSNSWLKLKKFNTIDVFIMGYNETDTSLHGGPHMSYRMGVMDGLSQKHVGDVSSCMDSVDRSQIKPGTVVEVKYQKTQGFSKLRHPTVVRIRTDKTPDECLASQL